MDLADEERGWALAIKEALRQQDPELAARTFDLEIAHHALIAKDKVAKALKRIERLEAFRKEHGIVPNSEVTAEDALRMIQKFEAGSPGFFLSLGKCKRGYLSTWDYAKFLPANYKEPQDWKDCFAAFYYVLEALQPDLEAVRSGIIMLCDADGLGWKNFSLEMEKHAAHLYQDAYPLRIQTMTMLNTPVVFKAMYALCKPFLSRKVKEAIVLNGRLVEDVQEKYPKDILGTTQGGTQTTSDMEVEMLKGLKLRYSNMASFRLEEAPTTTTTEQLTEEVVT